jgi:hypothetical protein
LAMASTGAAATDCGGAGVACASPPRGALAMASMGAAATGGAGAAGASPPRGALVMASMSAAATDCGGAGAAGAFLLRGELWRWQVVRELLQMTAVVLVQLVLLLREEHWRW